MSLLIIGTGGHARDLRFWFSDQDVDLVEEKNLADHLRFSTEMPECLIGINDSQTRSEVAARWPMLRWAGTGTVVSPHAILGPFTHLGAHVHVNSGVFLTRCEIGQYTTIGPNATICGDVKIGARCMIGAGAVIKNLVTIGDDVTVGAGAVVINDVPDGQTVVGVPARPVNEPAEPLHRWKGPGLGTWEFDPARGGWNRVSK